jgi:hypothetical protein
VYPLRDPESELYGFWSYDKWAIPPRFAYAHGFHHGFAAVRTTEDRHALIEAGGTLHDLRSVCGGRLPVGESFSGFIDGNSDPYDFAIVPTGDAGRPEWGLIDRTLTYTPLPAAAFRGVTAAQCHGDHIVLWRDTGRVGESLCGLFCLRDRDLKLPLGDRAFNPSKEPVWVVWGRQRAESTARNLAFLDVNTYRIVSDWYWGALPFSEGLGAVNADGGGSGWSYVGRGLRPAFDAVFDDVGPFAHGLAAVYKGGDAGYIDATGGWKLVLPYDRLTPFNRFGWAIANRDESDWDLDIIGGDGKAHVSGLETCVFYDGDFPYFVASANGKDLILDMELRTVFAGP